MEAIEEIAPYSRAIVTNLLVRYTIGQDIQKNKPLYSKDVPPQGYSMLLDALTREKIDTKKLDWKEADEWADAISMFVLENYMDDEDIPF